MKKIINYRRAHRKHREDFINYLVDLDVVVFIAGDMKYFTQENFKRLYIKKILNRLLEKL